MTIQENVDDTLASIQYYKTLEARFDKAAKLYDATYGPPTDGGRGNALIGWLQAEFLAVLRECFPTSGRLIDIGSGTGSDALVLAKAGYNVLGLDVSPAMVRQAQTKMAVYGVQPHNATFHVMPAGFLRKLKEQGPFRGAYSNLGALNTEPNLAGLARALHSLLDPGAVFVAVVMSQSCLFERLNRSKTAEPLDRSGEWKEARAGAGGVLAPVKFYTPEDFAAPFVSHFTIERVWAFPLWLPPIHLHELYNQNPEKYRRRAEYDRRMRAWRIFRSRGDHFLMVLRHNS